MLKGDKSERTPWCHMFMTVVFRKAEVSRGSQQCQNHQQPLPDFRRWLYSKGKLHCLPYEGKRLRFPNRPWNSVPGITFLATFWIWLMPWCQSLQELCDVLLPCYVGCLNTRYFSALKRKTKTRKKTFMMQWCAKKKKESLTVWSKIRNTGKHVQRLESSRE